MGIKLTRYGKIQQYAVTDHNILINRDMKDQHPISAITGLEDEIKNLHILQGQVTNGTGTGGGGIALKKLSYVLTYEYNETNKLVKEIYSGDIQKTVDYEYDTNNNIISKTITDKHNNSAVINYVYDDKNDLVSIKDNGTNILGYEIDAVKTIDLIPCIYEISLEYNNHLLTKEIYNGDIQKTVEYQYNENNDIIEKKITEKNGKEYKATFEYNDLNNLVKITDKGTEYIPIINSVINREKRITRLDYLQYDDKNRLIKEELKGTISSNIEYTYDNNNNITLVAYKDDYGGEEDVIYEYNSKGYISKITDNCTTYIGIDYNENEIDVDDLLRRVTELEQKVADIIEDNKEKAKNIQDNATKIEELKTTLNNKLTIAENNILILKENENTLKEALQEALSRIDELNDHIQKKEFEYDKILNITSSQDTSFTDILDTDNNIEELEECTYNSDNKDIE